MPEPTPKPGETKPPHPKRDSFRELVETIAFVVSLVLMLKLFVVEAFVIPTGSMAETLLGYNKIVTCPECGFDFPVNSSNEVDPSDGVKRPVTGACCPNCRVKFAWKQENTPENRSGDRVLVHKAVYSLGPPQPGDVVVFKFPVDPQVTHTAQNYIKRLWGTGNQTLAINRGDLFRSNTLLYPEGEMDTFGNLKYPRPDADQMDRLWEGPEVFRHSKTRPPYQPLGPDFTYHNAPRALTDFEHSRKIGFTLSRDKSKPGDPMGSFEIIRKSDPHAITMRRNVYNNDHQSSTLNKAGVLPRWGIDGSGWKTEAGKTFTHSGNELAWLRYRHRISGPMTDYVRKPDGMWVEFDPSNDSHHDWPRQSFDDWIKLAAGFDKETLFAPSLITNYLGYNAGSENGIEPRVGPEFWVGDLMLECTAKVSGPGDEVVLEVSRGVSRFQARFAEGKVTLSRVSPTVREIATRPTTITSAGTYQLRFANFDYRLRVWVNDERIDFGTDADHNPAEPLGFETAIGGLTGGAFAPRGDGCTLDNDILRPASLGSKGSVEISRLQLWQDTYFTPSNDRHAYIDPEDPVDTFYVQPGHYLCLGDNSGQSSDSRKWGLVPERLMLGKAVFVFFPAPPFTEWKNNRVGFIR